MKAKLLVILLLIVPMAYGTMCPNRCTGPAGLDCLDSPDMRNGIVKIIFKNSMDYGIKVFPDFKADGECYSTGTILEAETYVSGTYSKVESFPFILNKSQSAKISLDCGIKNTRRAIIDLQLKFENLDTNEVTEVTYHLNSIHEYYVDDKIVLGKGFLEQNIEIFSALALLLLIISFYFLIKGKFGAIIISGAVLLVMRMGIAIELSPGSECMPVFSLSRYIIGVFVYFVLFILIYYLIAYSYRNNDLDFINNPNWKIFLGVLFTLGLIFTLPPYPEYFFAIIMLITGIEVVPIIVILFIIPYLIPMFWKPKK